MITQRRNLVLVVSLWLILLSSSCTVMGGKRTVPIVDSKYYPEVVTPEQHAKNQRKARRFKIVSTGVIVVWILLIQQDIENNKDNK